MAFEPKPQKHLIHILKTTSNPNFTLFLGAGASVTSGVKHAGELIKQWRATYLDMYPSKELNQEYWHETPTEYSELFERLYDQPSQRREFIESCLKDAVPSWGYIYLSNLLKNNIFNTVFTTNFDDLINEACYSFSTDLKPLVSAHDSSISSVRITSPRPKIIKLHGDFLFDNIKNTVRELESLEDNMRAKFKQYASEFGMIVIGYAGNDRSIMETLNTLLRYDSNFPHGIYWCVMKGTQQNDLSKDLEELTRFPRFHLIEIDGFDELLADIHHDLGLKVQEEVSEPYRHLANRLDSFVKRNDSEENGHPHHAINEDIQKLKEHIQKVHSGISVVEAVEKILTQDGFDKDDMSQMIEVLSSDLKPIINDSTDELHLISAPHALLADFAIHDDNFEQAYTLSKQALDSRVTVESIATHVRSLIKLEKMEEFETVKKIIHDVKTLTSKQTQKLISVAVELMENKDYLSQAEFILNFINTKSQDDDSSAYTELNLALIKRLRNEKISAASTKKLNSYLSRAIEENDHWLIFGLSLILDVEELTVESAKSLSTGELGLILEREMPITALISDSLYETLESLLQLENDDENQDIDEESPIPNVEGNDFSVAQVIEDAQVIDINTNVAASSNKV